MIELTNEQSILLANETPPRLMDPATEVTYVLVREDTYNRVKGLLASENEQEELLEDIYPHVMQVFGRDGWDDPAMDVYNELDPRRVP